MDTNEIIRKIIHIDMDAFYASVEQRDNQDLRGKPLAVGSANKRGVVAAASYEARAFGVHSAMPSVTAARKCPNLIFVSPRFDVYRAVSQQIHAIFAEYTSLIEPLSLDEAYLDVTKNHYNLALATEVAQQIREKILQQTHLTASAGISYNKFLAKMASSQRKPNGQFVIPPGKGEEFVKALPIKKFHGVGPATTEKMKLLGIETGADLKQQSLSFLLQHFGKIGAYFFEIARGIDNRSVNPNRMRKSVSVEDTFSIDLVTLEEAKQKLLPLIRKLGEYLNGRSIRARTVTVKIKYADFRQITRSKSVAKPIADVENITVLAFELIGSVFPTPKPIRLLGIGLSSFTYDTEDDTSKQMNLAI